MKWFELLEARWQAWWPELESREQRMIIVAGTLVVLALVWWIGLAPALRTLSAAPEEHARLDAQLQQMTQLQTQAKALQSQPRANREDALRALEASVRQNFGPNAQMQPAAAGEGVTVAVRAAPADSLAQWFAQARGNARAVPREVHLTRAVAPPPPPPTPPVIGPGSTPGAAAPLPRGNPNASTNANGDSARVRWDGTLVMGLPAR